jgi:hypothetical protein
MDSEIFEALQYMERNCDDFGNEILNFKAEHWTGINNDYTFIVACRLCRGDIWRCACQWEPMKPKGCLCSGNKCKKVYLRTWTGQPIVKEPVCSSVVPRDIQQFVKDIQHRLTLCKTKCSWDEACSIHTPMHTQRIQYLENENTLLQKDIVNLKREVETLKKALADTLVALATK